MNRRIEWKSLSLALAATLMFGTAALAQCDAGSCGGGGYVDGGYAAGGGFGYPAGGSQGCGGGGGCLAQKKQNLKNQIDHLKHIQQRDFARNQAWWKPFSCADRQIYFAMWDPMLSKGTRCNCLLTANHFDPETNELNQLGMSKIQGIFKSGASSQKMALVQNFGNRAVVDARLQNVQSTINQWYGNQSFVQVAVSGNFQPRFSGQRVFDLQNLSAAETPAPVIPVATGTGTTSDVGIGN